jgi:hypothetical protein
VIIQVYQAGGFAGSDPMPLGRLDTSELSPDDQARSTAGWGHRKPTGGLRTDRADLVECVSTSIRTPGRRGR